MQPHLIRNHLRRQVRRMKRIERAARKIDADVAMAAYAALVGANGGDDTERQVAIGRLAVLFDENDLLEDR
jgi:hypothetical protein